MKIAYLLTAVAAFAWPSMATAAAPTEAELQHAEAVANAYWHGNPPCGQPQVMFGSAEYWGEAHIAECRIELNESVPWPAMPIDLCEVVAHEWGHMVLGPTYFASVNPGEPDHSPDPTNIMFGGGGREGWQQEAAQRSVGCLPPLPIKVGFALAERQERRALARIARRHHHHRRHRHHRRHHRRHLRHRPRP